MKLELDSLKKPHSQPAMAEAGDWHIIRASPFRLNFLALLCKAKAKNERQRS
jgi:hypothetical protein